jgi:hypothetical protein
MVAAGRHLNSELYQILYHSENKYRRTQSQAQEQSHAQEQLHAQEQSHTHPRESL